MAEIDAAMAGALRSAGQPDPALLPDRLAIACALVLPVAGVGLSFSLRDGRRLPVGASNLDSATAERLQFTVGEGPCLQASGQEVLAGPDQLAHQWPVYARELAARTPFRSVVSLPLADEFAHLAALSLYSEQADLSAALDLTAARSVRDFISNQLMSSMASQEDRVLGEPAWLHTPRVEDRYRVWQAIGYLNAQRGTTSTDSLALLRGHAYARALDLKDTAGLVLAGELP